MQYPLLNFDHGMKYPISFPIGPFNIKITKLHCVNLEQLPRNGSWSESFDNDYKPIIKEVPRKRGVWVETAVAIIEDKDIKTSVIFPEGSPKSSIDDLCLFLSFISGRAVAQKSDPFIDHLNSESHEDKVLHYGYFLRNSFPWNNLSKLREQGVAGQFYNLTVAYHSNDLVAQTFHYNNVLNVAFDKWCNNNQIAWIDKKLRGEISSCIKNCLETNNVKKEIKNDVMNRAGNILFPSALSKLKHFLRGIDLYPTYEKPEMHERLKMLNKIRNLTAHTGIFPSGKTRQGGCLDDVTSAIIELVLRISQYYYAKIVLSINDPYLEFIKNQISPYFIQGKVGNWSIFEEPYEDHIIRIKKEWVRKG